MKNFNYLQYYYLLCNLDENIIIIKILKGEINGE